jgi:transposase
MKTQPKTQTQTCEKCGATLHREDLIEDADNMQRVWKCRACGHDNGTPSAPRRAGSLGDDSEASRIDRSNIS